MNWRDPTTNLVHTVDYRTNTVEMWGVDRAVWGNDRFMGCGLRVGVTKDGLLEPAFQGAKQYVLKPWLHTEDHPTCLECVVWTAEAYENEADT